MTKRKDASRRHWIFWALEFGISRLLAANGLRWVRFWVEMRHRIQSDHQAKKSTGLLPEQDRVIKLSE